MPPVGSEPVDGRGGPQGSSKQARAQQQDDQATGQRHPVTGTGQQPAMAVYVPGVNVVVVTETADRYTRAARSGVSPLFTSVLGSALGCQQTGRG